MEEIKGGSELVKSIATLAGLAETPKKSVLSQTREGSVVVVGYNGVLKEFELPAEPVERRITHYSLNGWAADVNSRPDYAVYVDFATIEALAINTGTPYSDRVVLYLGPSDEFRFFQTCSRNYVNPESIVSGMLQSPDVFPEGMSLALSQFKLHRRHSVEVDVQETGLTSRSQSSGATVVLRTKDGETAQVKLPLDWSFGTSVWGCAPTIRMVGCGRLQFSDNDGALLVRFCARNAERALREAQEAMVEFIQAACPATPIYHASIAPLT